MICRMNEWFGSGSCAVQVDYCLSSNPMMCAYIDIRCRDICYIHIQVYINEYIYYVCFDYRLCMMMRIQRSKTCVYSSGANIFRCIYPGFLVASPFVRSKTTSYFGRWVESLKMSLERSSQKALFCLALLRLTCNSWNDTVNSVWFYIW